MKNILLALFVLTPVVAVADADAAVNVLACRQITLAKSSYHFILKYDAAAKAYTSDLRFNVEKAPRAVFGGCKGNHTTGLSCRADKADLFLNVWQVGEKTKSTVALVKGKTAAGQVNVSFVCEGL